MHVRLYRWRRHTGCGSPGTTFKIYHPRTDEPLSLKTADTRLTCAATKLSLVVEDQLEVRTLALVGLAAYGYSVHGVGTGKEALALCREFAGDLDLVVTDVVMPGMK
jgi:two-component system cell cycle sensor histidine kinase/response regulator CckA